MDETTTDDTVHVQLHRHFEGPDAPPINAVSVLRMLEPDHPDLTVAQVLSAFRALARDGRVRLLHHDGHEMGVVEEVTT